MGDDLKFYEKLPVWIREMGPAIKSFIGSFIFRLHWFFAIVCILTSSFLIFLCCANQFKPYWVGVLGAAFLIWSVACFFFGQKDDPNLTDKSHYQKSADNPDLTDKFHFYEHIVTAGFPHLFKVLNININDVDDFWTKLNSPEKSEIKDAFDVLYSSDRCSKNGECESCISETENQQAVVLTRCLCRYLFYTLFSKYECKIHSWSIMRYSKEGKTLHVQVPGNLRSGEKEIVIKEHNGVAGHAVDTKKIYYEEDINVDGARFKLYNGVPEPKFKSIISAPLIYLTKHEGTVTEEIFGVLNIQGVNTNEFGRNNYGAPEQQKKCKEIKKLVREFSYLLNLSLLLTNQQLNSNNK